MHRKKWYGFVTSVGILLVLALSQSVATSSQSPLPGTPDPVGAPAEGTADGTPTTVAVAVPTLEPTAQAIGAATRVAAFATARAATPTVIPALGPSETAWRTFTHTAHGYRIKYPPYLYLYSSGTSFSSTTLSSLEMTTEKRRLPDPTKEIKIQISGNQMKTSTLLEHVMLVRGDISEPQPRILSSDALTISGHSAIRRVLRYTLRTGESFTADDFFVETGLGTVLSLGASPGDSVHINDFHKIVQSLELLR